ncbi:MAG: endonuclease domain-containing protein [Clostridia bacterium]|nr:endonuclease domain-containing protein [Clostridia bacterium]
MNDINNPRLTPYSKELRKNMTREECLLWYDFFKKLDCNINRQKVIGKYIVDFCCSEAKLIIEVDGIQHLEEDAKKYDEKRDSFLRSKGYRIIRLSNFDVTINFEFTCKRLLKELGSAVKGFKKELIF